MLGFIRQNLPMQPWITKVTQGFVIGDILKSIKGHIRWGGELQTIHITFIEGGSFETQRQVDPKIWSSHHCCGTWKTFMELFLKKSIFKSGWHH
jgi:hypothetical protein